MAFALAAELFSDAWTDMIDSAKSGLQKNKYTKFFSRLYGMGYRGGAFNGRKANEIIYKDDGDHLEVYGYRKWDADKGEAAVTDYADLKWDGEQLSGFNNGGLLVKEDLQDMYDDNFSLFGAEKVVAAGKVSSEGEETEMREEFVKNAIRFYTISGKQIGNGFYVAEVPYKDEIKSWGDFMANWDMGLALYYAAQTASYYVTDWVSTKFRKAVGWFMPKFLREHFQGKQKDMTEERLRRQYKRFTDNVNKWLGIDRDFIQKF